MARPIYEPEKEQNHQTCVSPYASLFAHSDTFTLTNILEEKIITSLYSG